MNAYGRATAEASGIKSEKDIVNAIHATLQEACAPKHPAKLKKPG